MSNVRHVASLVMGLQLAFASVAAAGEADHKFAVFGKDAQELTAKFTFAIPSYPGTEEVRGYRPQNITPDILGGSGPRSIGFSRLLRSKDGSPLDLSEIRKFYEDHYRSLQWKQWKVMEELRVLHFLVRATSVGRQCGHIQVSAYAYVVIAPRDGLILVQHTIERIPTIFQPCKKLISKVTETIEATLGGLGNRTLVKPTGTSHSHRYFEDLSLLKVISYDMIPRDSEPFYSGLPREGDMTLDVLVYTSKEAAKRQTDRLTANGSSNQLTQVKRYSITVNNIVVHVQDLAGTESKTIAKLTSRLKELVN